MMNPTKVYSQTFQNKYLMIPNKKKYPGHYHEMLSSVVT